MKAKWPQYYDNGRYKDIPEETIEELRKILTENPDISKRDLWLLNGDILSDRERNEVEEYIKSTNP